MGQLFLRMAALAGPFVKLFSHPAGLVQAGTKSALSVNLTTTIHPIQMIPCDLTSPHLLTRPKLFQ